MKNCKIETSFMSPEFMIFILIFVENCLLFDNIHKLSVRARTGSNPPGINRFGSHTSKFLRSKDSLLVSCDCMSDGLV